MHIYFGKGHVKRNKIAFCLKWARQASWRHGKLSYVRNSCFFHTNKSWDGEIVIDAGGAGVMICYFIIFRKKFRGKNCFFNLSILIIYDEGFLLFVFSVDLFNCYIF